MAVQQLAIKTYKYTGLSSDTKPTIAVHSGIAEPTPGSTFLATDTQTLYITHDGTTWVLKDPYGEVQASPTTYTLLDRLKALLTGIVLAAGTAIIGKVGIDQTTPGTTNRIDIGLDATGVYTTPTHTQPSVGAVSTIVLAANANRLYALLVNDSNEVIYIKLGANAMLNQGIRINASGGSYEISKKLGNLYTGAINGICVSGSKVCLVTEGV